MENNFLALAKELSLRGPSKYVYKRRVELLRMHFEENTICDSIKLIDAQCNVSKIMSYYLTDEPSLIEKIICDRCGEHLRNLITITLPMDFQIIELCDFMNDLVQIKKIPCKNMWWIENINKRATNSFIF